MDFEQRNGKENEMTIIDGMPATILTGTTEHLTLGRTKDGQDAAVLHPDPRRAACYEDMPPEGQARARLFVIRKAGNIRRLKAAADAPGGELATELLQKLQQPYNHG